MTTSNGYEEQTRRLLAETKSELSIVEAEIAELTQKSLTLQREVDAFETALTGYLRRTGRQAISENNWLRLLGAKEMTHKKRLIAIAERKGGRIRVSEATDILYSKGFIKSKKRMNAYTIVQSLLTQMAEEGKFEKVEPGEFRLIGAQQSLMR